MCVCVCDCACVCILTSTLVCFIKISYLLFLFSNRVLRIIANCLSPSSAHAPRIVGAASSHGRVGIAFV